MIKEHVKLFRRVMIFSDMLIVVFAFLISYHIRSNYLLEGYIKLLPVFVLTWIFLLYIFGMYYSFRTESYRNIIIIVAEAAVFGFIVFGNIIYLMKWDFVSRYFVIQAFIICTVLVVIEKIFLILFFKYWRKKGYNYKNILIIGTGTRAQSFIKRIEKHSEWGFVILGLIDEDPLKKGQMINNYNVIGCFEDLADILHANIVDHAIFVVPRLWFEKIEHLIDICEVEGVPVTIAVDLFELKFTKAKQTDFDGFPLLTFQSTPDEIGSLFVKRVIDIIISGIALIILSPLFIIITMIRKITKRSVFFKQERCSLNGRKFTLYKFRTMIEGAEEKLGELSNFNEMNGPAFKMKNDPRITKSGHFMRKFSIDEFPQLWNVFKGDMSIVGPRPPLPTEVNKYDSWHRRRLSMKPGLTCFWQIKGRSEITDFNEWMKLDLEYIDKWSLLLDLKIILRTIPIVLLGKGAK